MNTITKIIFVVLLCASYNATTMAQNLKSMPFAERDALLISIAKEAVLTYGPDYYREYREPIIGKRIVPPVGGVDAGRTIFEVTFLYDKTQETLHMNFAARVHIWGDTGQPLSVDFGNGIGLLTSEGRRSAGLDGIQTRRIPFQQVDPIPIFDPNNPDPNREPLNIDEFIERGFVRSERGYWMPTRPDTPPAEAQQTIRRAQEELRQRQIEREREGNSDTNRENRR